MKHYEQFKKMSDEVKDYETGLLLAKIMSMRTYDDKGRKMINNMNNYENDGNDAR